ncbi:carboxypeptidase-like regulatory domain-containing protein [Acinetobacter haemolyticus]|uniref:carboxypeptidase-like regulatory domain-containing protein n=1 Tax=Acinetobacter haemolyticus TaxID=29430 RepID=UPI0009492B2C|nr:carboxypeptidase-like regulatory domain-containing protein [Acinetobacter haemolyticus]APR71483.1 hypothetical protein AHTJS_14730 [Acinetobacter haemolyticus]
MFKSRKLSLSLLTLSVSSALLLTACGGGSGGSSGGNPPVAATLTGRVVDGPIANATVTFTDEATACKDKTATTDANGVFTFPQGCTASALKVTGGQDTTTGLPFTATLEAPKISLTDAQGVDVVVTPITTLISKVGEAQAQKIATALGLGNVGDLLKTDPLTNKTLLAKTVAAQQLIEQITKAATSLDSSLSSEQVSQAVIIVLANELANTTVATSLSDSTLVSKIVTQTVNAVKDQLPEGELKNHINEAGQNLAALTANVIAKNVENTETAINALTDVSTTQAIKVAGNAIIEQKSAVTTQNLVQTLAEVLIQDPTKVQAKLAIISTQLAQDNTDTTAITDAITAIETATGVQIDNEAVISADQFNPNHLKLEGLSIGEIDFTLKQLDDSYGNAIKVPSLDNILVSLNGAGTYKDATTTVGAALQFDSLSNNKSVSLYASDLKLTYSNGTLTKAVLPQGSVIFIGSTQSNIKTQIGLANEINVLSNGKIALNSTTLKSISPTLATQLDNFNKEANSARITAIIIPGSKQAIAVTNTLGNLTFAYESSVCNFEFSCMSGSGVLAKVDIQK